MNINFKLILRNLVKGKIHTALNIASLSIGFACALIIIIWIKSELSYDKHLPDRERIYRLTFETNNNGTRVHFARCWEWFVSKMPDEFPQIEELVRLSPFRHTALTVGENKFYSDRIFATDSNFFKVFASGLIYGDVEKALSEPSSAVISASLSLKCFGDINPIGQTILMSGEYDDKMSAFTITGVMKDSPKRSHIHFDIMTSFTKPEEPPAWAYVYLLLRKGTNTKEILEGIPAFIKKTVKESSQIEFIPFLQRITDIHLYSDKDREIESNGNITSVYLFVVIAIILLMVSWINYYNLSKARLLTLYKPIQVQIILGANGMSIIVQNIIESVISVVLALILAIFIYDTYNRLVVNWFGFNKIQNGLIDFFKIWPLVVAILIISVIAGTIPIILKMLFTSRRSIGLADIQKVSTSGFSSYGILMIMQFCLAIVLIFSTITILQQKNLILNHSLGKKTADILVFKKLNWVVRNKYDSFRANALHDPNVINMTASMEEPSGETMDVFKVESPEIDINLKDQQLYVLPVEDNFLTFFNIPLIAGRNFSPYNPDRKGEDYILNESAIKKLNWTTDEAIGRQFNLKFDTPGIFYGGKVVGVVRDFNFTSLKQEIKPYVFFQKPIFYLCFMVQVDSMHKQQAILSLRKIWEEEFPDYPFQYEFLSDVYNSTYNKEFTQAKLSVLFSLMNILIICFGLFSVTSVLVVKRTKEIGIRKVNGGNVLAMLVMLHSRFLKWFVISFILACPIAYYSMHKWLRNFVYRIELKWWEFIIAGLIVLCVTILTVTIQCWRSAARNPVESLRYE